MSWNQTDPEFKLDTLLVQFRQIEDIEGQLKFVLVLLYALGNKHQPLFMDDIEKIEKIFSNTEFLRAVRHRDALVRDNPAEYFGRDFGPDDPYLYQEQLENDVNSISIDLMNILGRVIKTIKEDTLVLPDNE